MKSWAIAIALLLLAASPILWAPQSAAQTASVDAHAEVAAALYAASATQAAFEKSADAKLRADHARIAELTKMQLRAEGRHRAELIAAQEAFVAELSARDRAYGEAIAVFRGAITDIAATPEGAAALARFNAGDEAGALAILDRLRAADDQARRKRSDIESAAAGRRIADLALEARTRGKQTTAQVTARFEEVVRLDPAVSDDFVQLAKLYLDADRSAEALGAAASAVRVARGEPERAAALMEQGNVLIGQEDLIGSRAAYQESLDIRRRLAAADPASADAQRDLAASLVRVGDALSAQGDLPGARKAFEESLSIRRKMSAADPDNIDLEARVSTAADRLGQTLEAQGDFVGARKVFEEGLAINRTLLAGDHDSSLRQQNVSAALEHMATPEALAPLLRHFWDQRKRNKAFFVAPIRGLWVRRLAEMIEQRLVALAEIEARPAPALPWSFIAVHVAEVQITLVANWLALRPTTRPDIISAALIAITRASIDGLTALPIGEGRTKGDGPLRVQPPDWRG